MHEGAIRNIFFPSRREQAARETVRKLKAKRDNASTHRLNQRDSTQLAQSESIAAGATRRQILAWGGAGVVMGGFALTGLNLWENDQRKDASDGEYRLPTPQELYESINELPPSPIKDLLKERVQPYFSDNPPTEIVRGGITIKINKPVLSIHGSDDHTKLGGSATHVGSELQLTVQIDTQKEMPYVGAFTESDIAQWQGSYKDSHPTLISKWSAGRKIMDGVTPEISLVLPTQRLLSIQRDEIKRTQIEKNKWLFIKEAATLLMVDLAIEATILKMKDLGEDPYADVLDKNGNERRTEIVTDFLRQMGEHPGRMWSSLDIAGALVSVQAVTAGGVDPEHFKVDPGLNAVYPELKSVELGAGAQEIFANEMRWSALDSDASFFQHAGKRNVLP